MAQAISNQSGSGTVRGYVVGQPTATRRVVRSGFPDDYAMALADSAGETSTARMVYVQIPAAFRSTWGLRSHPERLGRQLDVTGTLASYFSHPGLTNGTAIADAGGGDPGAYYAGTDGLSGDALEAWSAADPPDAFEERRNEEIFENWHHNRNPFVDHPEWADAIW